jgi:hypothetical protein
MASSKKGSKPCRRYSEKMQETLLYLVRAKGAHICSKGVSSDVWDRLIDDLFKNDEYIDWKDEFFSTVDLPNRRRYIKDNYNRIREACNKMMANGNTSALPGGAMSEKYKLVKAINEDKEEEEDRRKDAKEAKEEEKKHLADNEAEAIKCGHKKGRVGKQADGTILARAMEPSTATKASKDPFEEYVRVTLGRIYICCLCTCICDDLYMLFVFL